MAFCKTTREKSQEKTLKNFGPKNSDPKKSKNITMELKKSKKK